MTERQKQPYPSRAQTEPMVLGFRAGSAADDAGRAPAPPGRRPATPGRPAVPRRPDRLAGVLLLLSGLAAGLSLAFPWLVGGTGGLTLVRRGIGVFGAGVGELGRSGLWQPLAVVLGGAALFLLGLLLYLPARTHRAVGVLALFVAVPAAAAVLVPFAYADWNPTPFGRGMWCAAVAAGLGVLGALKAMLTGPLLAPVP
jgi:hypothetical protein